MLFVDCYYLLKSKLRLVTLFGAGILLSASLVVVIPEGVDAIYLFSVKSSVNLQGIDNHKLNIVRILNLCFFCCIVILFLIKII